MTYLFMRLCELRDEYFNELSVYDLSAIHGNLDINTDYSSDTLITLMKNYSDVFNGIR